MTSNKDGSEPPPFLVLLQVYRQGLIKKELDQAFGGDSSFVSLKTPSPQIPGLWALASLG